MKPWMMLFGILGLGFFAPIASAQPVSADLRTALLVWDAPTTGGPVEVYHVVCKNPTTGVPVASTARVATLPREIPVLAALGGALRSAETRCAIMTFNIGGFGPPSNEVTIPGTGTPPPPPPALSPPGAAQNLRIVPGP